MASWRPPQHKKGPRAGPALNVVSETCDSSDGKNKDDADRVRQEEDWKGPNKSLEKGAKKSPRLPRELWGTPAAKERERELQRVRQQRRRARLRAELVSEARGGHSSDSESEEEAHMEPAQEGVAAPAVDILGEANNSNSSCEEGIEKEHTREQPRPVACETLVKDLPLAKETALGISGDDDLDQLAELFAKIKCTSNVSDSAMDKLFAAFVENNDQIMRLVKEGRVSPSYSKSIRPLVTSKLLPIYNSLYLLEKNARGNRFHKMEGLKKIPQKYLNLSETKKWKLLRMEAYVHLEDIKKQFILQHGDNEETRKHLLNCQLSVDGVCESRKGARTFIIASLRIANCLYLLHVFNPLVGVSESKPTAVELLK